MGLENNMMGALVMIWKIGQNLAILLKKSGFRLILANYHNFEAHQRFFGLINQGFISYKNKKG